MKPTIVAVLLIAPALNFGQQFSDLSPKGSPVSLSTGFYPSDPRPYVLAQNNSDKGVLAIVAVSSLQDKAGQKHRINTEQDYVFKFGVLKSHDRRAVAPAYIPKINNSSSHGGSVAQAVDDHPDPVNLNDIIGNGAVLFVQFEDGTTWGDSGAGRHLLDSRPETLGFFEHLVDTYYEGGENAFNAMLSQPQTQVPLLLAAACLKADAERDKVSTVDLAKQRLAAAEEWHARGIF